MTDADLLTLIRATPALRALADAGHDDVLAQEIPALANVTTPKPFSAADIMGVVSAANRAKVAVSAMYFGIQQSIAAQDRAAIGAEVQLCVDAGLITTEEQASVMGVLAATVTEPDTSVKHEQVSSVLAPLRLQEDGSHRALPIAW